MAELGHQFEVNPVTNSKWKNEFLERMSVVFESGTSKKSQESSHDLEQLYAQIGQLKLENDFLKKVQRDWGYQTKNGNDPAKLQNSFNTKAM